ncbi:hypothetical protein RRF57_002323 [Xylaria bambusicola]|uniref:F-box domain-containing protein n=1 Tax=Xylaria bambusicola TaxID=326684 RepID=A0AAN7UDF0_9PEZI
MPLFHLPIELVELIFDEIVLSRRFVRALRIRLVNSRCELKSAKSLTYVLTLLSGQFKCFIDNSIFRLRLPWGHIYTHGYPMRRMRSSPLEWLPYLHSYVMYQVIREQPTTTTRFGRIRLVAQALTGSNCNLECLSSLICLAMGFNGPATITNTGDLDWLTNSNMNVDVFVAAAYLGQKDYVAHSISKGISVDPYSHEHNSLIFGSAMYAATIQGNLEMIKLLLSHTPEYRNTGSFPDYAFMCYDNSIHKSRVNTCDHEAMCNFNLDNTTTARAKSGDAMAYSWRFQELLLGATTPSNLQRVVALAPPSYNYRFEDLENLLTRSVDYGELEMVDFLLNKGVSPNIEGLQTTPLMQAVMNGDGPIFRILLDFGADLNFQSTIGENALTKAVWLGRTAMASVLLDRGADPNAGDPTPIVLAVFKEHLDMFKLLRRHGARLNTRGTGQLAMLMAEYHELSSMKDILVQEGVSVEHKLSVQSIPYDMLD